VSEIEFQYGAYIGKHMGDNPLRIKCNKFNTTDPVRSYGLIGDDYRIEGARGVYTHDECIPQLKSLESLSDQEWLFVFGGEIKKGFSIKKCVNTTYYETISEVVNSFNAQYGNFKYCSQQILNRLHSLHRSENEKALVEAELIEIVG
jgi:hypothetical protein